jgi:hypothetical protein
LGLAVLLARLLVLALMGHLLPFFLCPLLEVAQVERPVYLLDKMVALVAVRREIVRATPVELVFLVKEMQVAQEIIHLFQGLAVVVALALLEITPQTTHLVMVALV